MSVAHSVSLSNPGDDSEPTAADLAELRDWLHSYDSGHFDDEAPTDEIEAPEPTAKDRRWWAYHLEGLRGDAYDRGDRVLNGLG